MIDRGYRTAEKLSDMLKASRQHAGLTQDQLAGLSTVSVRAIRDLELGKVQEPRKNTVRLLADALRLIGPHRAAFELAGGASGADTLKQVYDLRQARPPISFGPFVGRQSELRAVTELVGVERERLVIVVGAIGVGKTRLVLEAAQALHARNGIPVLWVHMGIGANPASAPQHVLTKWIHEAVASCGPFHDLAHVIGDKPALVVLDGVDAQSSANTSLMRLLHTCHRLSVIVTTREPSAGLGGRLLPLAPLALPSPAAGVDGKWADQPATALMMSYLRHFRPDILPTESVVTIMARISRALDGVPQALKSAASWLPLYAPHELLEAATSLPLALTEDMGAADPGTVENFQRSLEQSVARLCPQHATLLRVMASKDASWTVDAVAQRARCTAAEALRGLHALVLRGLVRPVRYETADHSGVTNFAVLNLIRHVIRAQVSRPVLDGTMLLERDGTSACVI